MIQTLTLIHYIAQQIRAMQVVFYIIATLLILAGLAGALLPVLPGVPLVFAGMWLVAWTDHYQHIGWVTLTVLGVISALAIAIDFLASMLGAKRVGASGLALAGAAIGTVAGLFFGLFGLLLGPFIGAVIGETISGGTINKAAQVGLSTWIGLLFGTLLKLALCFTMIGVFLFAMVFG